MTLNNYDVNAMRFDVRDIKDMSDMQLLTALSHSQEDSRHEYLKAEFKRRRKRDRVKLLSVVKREEK